jgi:hypothetical protein
LIGFVPLGFDVGFFCRFSNIPFFLDFLSTEQSKFQKCSLDESI